MLMINHNQHIKYSIQTQYLSQLDANIIYNMFYSNNIPKMIIYFHILQCNKKC